MNVAGKASLLIAGLAVFLMGCAYIGKPTRVPSLHSHTTQERAESLETLQDLWNRRGLEQNEENRHAERVLLNRMCYFGMRCRGTEVFDKVYSLWHAAAKEHEATYGDPVDGS